MSQVTWTENALEDLELIVRMLAKDSPHYARMFTEQLFKLIEKLSRFPFIGRVVPELEDETIRRITYGSFRIIYRVTKKSDIVEILTIHHEAILSNPKE